MTLSTILTPQLNKVIDGCDPALLITDEEAAIIAQSDFIFEQLKCSPLWLEKLRSNPPLFDEEQHYTELLQEQLNSVTDEVQLMKRVRQFRNYHMLRIGWAQLCHTCNTEQTLLQLSSLAEVIIDQCRSWLYNTCCKEMGTPCNNEGQPQPLLILGMGKLGGKELNFSSDIDLIFAYPENGLTQGGHRQWDNGQFFTRLGQRLIKVLDQRTADGFVYRVDMRLRPFGESGPLVFSFAALEDYYQEQGRDWERYAMIKARLMGDTQNQYSKELYQMFRPFVYRRYIDFSVIQSLRNMKEMIEREVRRRNLINNIKLGAGGIREIEFIAQVFQLIRGGREPSLQNRSLLAALTAVGELKLLPDDTVSQLKNNYLFLRRLENLLQGINDEQTQTLPDNILDQSRLTIGMSYLSWAQLLDNITHKMLYTRTVFDNVIGGEETKQTEIQHEHHFPELWFETCDLDDIDRITPQYTRQQNETLLAVIRQFKQDLERRTIGVRGREVLDKLMPQLLTDIILYSNAPTVLPRMMIVLNNIVTRTTYLELLAEYPIVLNQLIKLCERSTMIATQLARHPILLDELIDQQMLYRTLPLTAYLSELEQYLLRIDNDEELQLEALRQFKQSQLLHIAAADINHLLPVMKVSDHLTYLAEAMIKYVVQLAWTQIVKRYGVPNYLQDKNDKGFLIVGYGKLGGLELGYSSDLDLVFLTDCPPYDVTNGVKCIDSQLFYLRLVQRIIHLFSTRTSSGILYEIDARLRPSGDDGLLVCSLTAFDDYQHNEAWTWEHQALTRARPIYGAGQLETRFLQIRHSVLSTPRDEHQLQQDVREMRKKMWVHLGSRHDEYFDLKTDSGGINDIEFISQYLVLRYANQQPDLTQWTDNVRILESMAHHNIMSSQEANQLIESYITMRDKIHHLSLQELPSRVSNTEFKKERKLVQESWKKWLGE